MSDLAWRAEGDGPPVLLIMGLGMPGAVWRPQVEGLRDRHRVLTFDHRGIGASPSLQGSWSLVDGACDALGVLEAAGHAQAHVVGVSMGGMVAQELALRWPERVVSLALVVTSPGGPLHWVPPLRTLPVLLRSATARDEARRHRALRALLHPPGSLDGVDDGTLAQRRRDIGPAPHRRTLRAQVRAVRAHDARQRLPGLQVPTLIVGAGRDRMIRPRRSDQLAALVPGASRVELPHAGHGLVLHAAEALNAALTDHFAAHSAGSTTSASGSGSGSGSGAPDV